MLSLVMMIFLLTVGDKLLLSQMKAKRFHGRQSIKNSIKNMCFRLNIGNAVYFESEELAQELVIHKLPWGQTYIVFGTQLRSILSPEEQNKLIWTGLQQVKIGSVQTRSIMTLLSYPYYLVLMWLESIKILATLKLFAHFMLYPYLITKSLLVQNHLKRSGRTELNLNDQERRVLLSVVTKKKSLTQKTLLLKELMEPNIIDGERFIDEEWTQSFVTGIKAT